MKSTSKMIKALLGGGLVLLLVFTFVGPAAAQTWTYTGNMNEARLGPVAALLVDGRVLVAGGNNALGLLNTAELYDPATETWTSTGSMYNTLQGAQGRAVLLHDGRVLVTGGGPWHNKAEIYDPTSGTWTEVPSMAYSRRVHTSTLLQNGKVLVVGGAPSGQNFWHATAEVYDPVGNTWSLTGSMSLGRWQHGAALLPDGRVLVAGGEKYYIPGPTYALNSTEIYDPVNGTWSAASDLSVPRIIHAANVLLDGTVLVSGGGGLYKWPWRFLGTNTAEIYDPESDTWTFTGSLSDLRISHSSTLLMDGTLLVAGGRYVNDPDPQVTVPTTELYDPTTGSWTLMDDLNEARRYHVAILLSDGSVLVAGGYDVPEYLSTAEIFRLTPQEQLEATASDLQDIIDSNPGPLADKVEDSLAKAQTALDELNKEPPDNQAAVGNLEGAVGDLEAAVNDGLFDPAQEGIDLMDELAGVARQLAAEALDQAIAQGGDPGEINDAEQALADGDAARESGLGGAISDFKEAVNKYKDALAKAESAIS